MVRLEVFDDYLESAITDSGINLSNIGTMIALAILEAGTEREAAIDGLERANQAFNASLEGEFVEQATNCVNGAIIALSSFEFD